MSLTFSFYVHPNLYLKGPGNLTRLITINIAELLRLKVKSPTGFGSVKRSQTISGRVVSREFLEVCRLKALMVPVHRSHYTWPGLLEHLG